MKTILLSLKNRVFKPKEVRIQVDRVKSTDLTVDQWRKDEHLVSTAFRVLNDQTFQLMLAALRNSHPHQAMFRPNDTQPHDRAAMQSRIEGYNECLRNLLALGVSSKQTRKLEATYGAEPNP